jgi:hypothetical protein
LAEGDGRVKEPRGVRDIIAGVDGLKGFPDAIEAIFPPGWSAALDCARGAQFASIYSVERAQAGDCRLKDYLVPERKP